MALLPPARGVRFWRLQLSFFRVIWGCMGPGPSDVCRKEGGREGGREGWREGEGQGER